MQPYRASPVFRRRPFRTLAGGLICAPMLAAFAAAAAVPEGEIAYVLGEGAQRQVHVLDLATRAHRPAGPGQEDGAPVWSPDGEWLAFESGTSGEGRAIHVVRADGGGPRRLESDHAWMQDPRWSPEGARIAYSGSADGGMERVLVVQDLETGAETVWGAGRPGMYRPVWLPHLNLMRGLDPEQRFEWDGLDPGVLLSEAASHQALLAIGLDRTPGGLTTGIFVVTPSIAFSILPIVEGRPNRYAEWHVEADRRAEALAYETNDGGFREIFVLGRRGITDVSNHRAADWRPAWSPRSDWIAFESLRGGRRGIYRVYPSTARVFPVAASEDHDFWHPAWSPRGTHLAYVSDADGPPAIWVVGEEGDGAVRVTAHDQPADAPAWRPRSGR